MIHACRMHREHQVDVQYSHITYTDFVYEVHLEVPGENFLCKMPAFVPHLPEKKKQQSF